MQRTANLITALTALALAVAFVAGLSFQAQRTDAAAATIAALNVGTCHTTDAKVLKEDDCNSHYQTFKFNRDGLEGAVEIRSGERFFATYAHDPRTADEPARAILDDSDLVKISINDEGRDVRQGVLISRKSEADGTPLTLETELDPTRDDGTTTPTPTTEGPESRLGGIVAAAIDGYAYDGPSGSGIDNVPAVETTFSFTMRGVPNNDDSVQITQPGIVELILSGTEFKPIARGVDRGEMRFFGSVTNVGEDGTDGNADDLEDITFGELNRFLTWDEDVVPGSTNRAPAVSLQANPRVGDTITLRAIHYLTSDVEYMMGGETCLPLSGSVDDPATDTDEGSRLTVNGELTANPNTVAAYIKDNQAACADDELGDNFGDYDKFVLEVSADGVQTDRNLYLEETGRFSGVFEGFVRLTDSDGNGKEVGTNDLFADDAVRGNWGIEVRHAPGEANADDRKDGLVEPDTGAVIGVDNGPVRIEYKDTDGTTHSFTVSIDIEPPTIEVSSPQNNGRSDDEEINFAGSLNDSESGLAEDSFALYVDHDDDETDANPALGLFVKSGTDPAPTQPEKLGVVNAGSDATDGVIATETQYAGFTEDAQTFGVVEANHIYLDVSDDSSTALIKGIDAEDHADGDSDAAFRDSVRINFRTAADDDPYNNAIDFHALVRDTAGNIGFSDSDEANPRYINDLGTKLTDRLGEGENAPLPNILGVFSRHVVYIDNVDPIIDDKRTVTGFYDVDGDDEPLVDRAGVMVVFDGPVDSRSIDTATFILTMGEKDEISLPVIDTTVSGKLVFLKLDDELASDATPKLTIAGGQEVRDLAGRVTRSEEQQAVTVNDGNLPVFTVNLSDGSGVGTGNEGPSRLTRETIKVSITSDEEISGAPKVAVVCSNLIYRLTDDDEDSDISDYVSGLSGATSSGQPGTIAGDSVQGGPDCGTLDTADNYGIRPATSLSRRDNTWEYTWRQFPAGNKSRVPDGMATVVVWGNDRSQYLKYDAGDNDSQIKNWGSTSTQFRFDETFETPLSDQSGGRVLPAADDKVAERRPFVLLDFSGEPTTVTVTELMVDGVDVTESIENRGQNQFLYWPATLSSGEHEVKFSARDAADNKVENQSFKFEVTSRDPFVLSLFAGWNAISFPADPRSNTLEDIFGESAVDRVIGWIPSSTTGPWAIATKADGVWMSSIETANLDTMKAQYGYWVHSTEFVDVSVELQGPIDRETGDVPLLTGVPTYPGWNFVGVVDQDGDQTEGRAGSNLKDGIVNVAGEANVGQQDDIEVKDYLAGFARAYRWDVITYDYQVLKGSDNVKIGEGIWVYFDAGIAP